MCFWLFSALQCYCHRCPNHTCATDGLCYVSITRSGSVTTQQSWCISDTDLIPRDRPFVCAPSNKDDTGIYPMCCDTDWCNKNPDLTSFPGESRRCGCTLYHNITWDAIWFSVIYQTAAPVIFSAFRFTVNTASHLIWSEFETLLPAFENEIWAKHLHVLEALRSFTAPCGFTAK